MKNEEYEYELANQPLDIRVDCGRLVISIGVNTITENIAWSDEETINKDLGDYENNEEFVSVMTQALQIINEDGNSLATKMLEDAANLVIETMMNLQENAN